MLSFYTMKRTAFFLFLMLFFYSFVFAQDIPTALYLPAQQDLVDENTKITVQYPYEKMSVSRGAKKIFIFGRVHLSGDIRLDINGDLVPVDKNGAFLAFLPVDNGVFEFVLTADNGVEQAKAIRRVIVPGKNIREFTDKAEFDPEETFPLHPVELLPSDVLALSVRGTPHAQVTVSLSGIKDAKNIPMKEDPSFAGIYRASYTIPANQKSKCVKVVYRMKHPLTGKKSKITAKEKVCVLDKKDPFIYAQIRSEGTKLRKIPTPVENLYPYYRAYGTVALNGRMNKQYRIALNEKESAWLEESKLKPVLFSSYSPNFISGLETSVQPQRTRLRLRGSARVPISVHEFNDRLELTLYYTKGFEENYSLDGTSPLVERIEWETPAEDTVLFTLYFKQNMMPWGHAYDFEENDLVLDLMHKPEISPQKDAPLNGARILIDAGHSPHSKIPYDGAVGPSGFLEYEANMALAEELKTLLESDGATVLMTREGNNHMSLQDRYRFALEKNAHIFISLHYNALPETFNPFAKPRGYSVYYNYPHSFQLAQAVYKAFTRFVSLPDNGMIANDVLFIPRIPQMPSILVENAYLIFPEQEAMAKTPQGRTPFLKALHEGILDFYGVKPAAVSAKKGKNKPRRKIKQASLSAVNKTERPKKK